MGARIAAKGRRVAELTVFDALSLAELEEAAGELHRRIGATLRAIGEHRADDADAEGLSPRRRVAAYLALLELAAATFAAIAAGVAPPGGRTDHHPAAIVAVMYATPTLAALLSRLEQDRRLLASHARGLEARLAEPQATAWGEVTPRRLLTDATIAEAARCALALDQQIAALEAASRAAEP